MFHRTRAPAALLLTLTLTVALAPAGQRARADEDRVLELKRDPVTKQLYAPDARGPRHGSMNKLPLLHPYTWREKALARGQQLRAKLYNSMHYLEHMVFGGVVGSTIVASVIATSANAPVDEYQALGGVLGVGGGWLWARAHDRNGNRLGRTLARAAAEQGPLLRALERKDMREVRHIAELQLDAMRALDAAVRVPEAFQEEAALVARNLWEIHRRAKTEYEDDAIAIIQGAPLSGPPMEGVPARTSYRQTHLPPPPIDYAATFGDVSSQLRQRAATLPRPKLGGINFQLPRFGHRRVASSVAEGEPGAQ